MSTSCLVVVPPSRSEPPARTPRHSGRTFTRGVLEIENAGPASAVYCFGGTRVACHEMNCNWPSRFAQILWKRSSTDTSLPLMVTS